MSETNPRQAAQTALKQAARAAKRGDLSEAERWSKTADRLAKAAERLAALPAEEPDPAAEEALRADLRARLIRLAEAEHGRRFFEDPDDPWGDRSPA